jgi:hypothetical protein
VADIPSPPSPEILEKLRQLREELAQKAAQQAPKDANTLAWQQSNAFKRVYPRAEGGAIHMEKGGRPPSGREMYMPKELTTLEKTSRFVDDNVTPFVNRGIDAMFPMREMARIALLSKTQAPIQKLRQQNPHAFDYAMDQASNGNMYPLPKQDEMIPVGRAKGGVIDMDRMRLELMNKGGLSKQERRANRKKFMEPSKDKRRFYHGSKEPNIVEFKTRKQIADENYPDDPSNDYRDERNAVFLSPDPKFTRHFSVEGYTDTGQAPTTYPVHVQARNPFDFDNPKHRENLWKTYHDIYYNPESELYAHGPHDTASEKTLAEMRMKKRIYESHKDENNWPLFENPNVQEAIQDMGHDSFYIKERGTKNLGVYDPRRIKSAIGNRGTYDINEPDINKKNGGITHAHQLDIEERPL